MKYTLPAKFKRLIVLGLGVIVLVILSISFLDHKAAHLLTEEQAAQSYRITRTLTDAGESSHFFFISLVCILIGWAFLKFSNNKTIEMTKRFEKIRLWGTTYLLALIGCGLVTHLIKFVVGRARPNQSEDRFPWDFDFFNPHWHFHSFPSGHSQTLFTSAFAIAFAFPKYTKLIYSLAAFLAITRILLNQHFLSDVLMGSYIGYSLSLIIFHWRFSSRSSSASS